MDMVAAMLTMTSLDLVALAAVVLIGLPHGALDGAIAMHLGYANKILNFISFIVLYVLMAGLVVALWIVMPAPCLLAFLIISMIHFGSGDARHGTGWMRGAEIMAHGGLVVAGISQMHRTKVDVVFGYLVGGDTTPLAPGMCFSNEPMICVPGEFGIRLEDHFYMTEDGPRWFTAPSKSIDDPFG